MRVPHRSVFRPGSTGVLARVRPKGISRKRPARWRLATLLLWMLGVGPLLALPAAAQPLQGFGVVESAVLHPGDPSTETWEAPAGSPDALAKDLQARWPDAQAVYLEQRHAVEMRLERAATGSKSAQPVLLKRHRFLLFLGPEAFRHLGEQAIGASGFRRIEDLQACTWVPGPEGYTRLPVTAFGERKRHTAGIFHDDLREHHWTFPGLEAYAIVEWRYTERILEPRFLGSVEMGSVHPVEQALLHIQVDTGFALGLCLLGADTALVQRQMSRDGARRQWAFARKGIPGLDREQGGPPWHSLRTEVLLFIRAMQDEPLLDGVDGLYAWYRELTREQDRQMARDTSIQHLARRITAGLGDGPQAEREKARRIFHWVQEQIRYIAFEEGLGGFVPRDPGLVCRRRYGDCKDMASLAVALMRAVGLEAERVWLGTRDLPYRYESVPTPMADNHMIAAVLLEDGAQRDWVFLDPTDPFLPFGLPSAFIQGRPALIGRGDAYRLDTIPVPDAGQSRQDLDLDLWVDGLVLLGKGRARLTGYTAMTWRQALAERSVEGRMRWVEDRLQLGNNRFELHSLESSGMEALDEALVLDFSFQIAEALSFVAAEVYLNPHLLRVGEKLLVDTPRSQVRVFDHCWSTALTLRLHAPQGWAWQFLPAAYTGGVLDASVQLDYSFQNEASGTHARVALELAQNNLEVSPVQLNQWNGFWKTILDRQRQALVLSAMGTKAGDAQARDTGTSDAGAPPFGGPPSDGRFRLPEPADGSAKVDSGASQTSWSTEAAVGMPAHQHRQDQPFGDPVMDSLWALPWPQAGGLVEYEEEKDHAAVVLLDRRWTDFEWRGGRLQQTERVQVWLQVRTQRGVERFNKVFVPVSAGDSLLAFHAALYSESAGLRIAAADQDVLEVDASAEHDRFRQCALQGMRVGDVVAYGYVRRKPLDFFGRQVLQRNIPVLAVDLQFRHPAMLGFATASYNGLPDAGRVLPRRGMADPQDLPAVNGNAAPGQADPGGNTAVWRLVHGPLEPAYKERYARYAPELQRLDWRITELPLYGMDRQDFGWCAAAERLAAGMGLDGALDRPGDSAAVAQWLSGIFTEPDSVLPSGENLSRLERAIKAQVGVLPEGAASPKAPEAVLRFRQADRGALLRLYAACFRQLGWPAELVLGASPDAADLDPGFPQWQALQEFFLFLPEQNRYIAPDRWAFRDGLIPPAWADRPAVHVSLTDEDAAAATDDARVNEACSMRLVPEAPLEGQYEILDLELAFDPQAAVLEVEATRSFTGLRAAYIRPYLPLMEGGDRQAVFADLLGIGFDAAPVTNVRHRHATPEAASSGLPWVLEGHLRLKKPVVQAGSRYLLHLGSLIGPQVQLYSEQPRRFAIDVDHPHGYRRRMRLPIPQGFQVYGLETLFMDRAVLSPKGDTVMAFRSHAVLEQDVLEVVVHEFYRHTRHPAEDDAAFRSVINAAADFNKRSVVLIPETYSAPGRRSD